MTKPTAHILDMQCYLPENSLSNAELADIYPEWPTEKIFEKTGIKIRHIAAVDETAVDLAFKAALALFANGLIAPNDIDFIILCTQAPDYVLPTSACILQNRLGIPKSAGAFDINLGCSGFVYALSVAKGLIETETATNVLLLTADTYSKYIHPLDKSVRTLFGDGAAATVIAASNNHVASIGPFIFGTDGNGAKNLIVEAGGFRNPLEKMSIPATTNSEEPWRSPKFLYMNGAEILTFSLLEVPKSLDALLKKSGYNKDDIDFFVFHQANKFMLDALRKKLKLPEQKMPIFLENCGNTVSSSIPLTLIEMRKSGQLTPGTLIALIGFGVGYSWAACLIKI
jgi:3-oxoacyl-[acyl-carrier-protein] synthase-3